MRFLFFLVSWFFISLVHAQSPVAFDSSVTDVTVYNQGALVTRTAQVSFKAGQQEIELLGFPSDIDIDALRIEAGDQSIRLGQVRTQTNILRDAQSAEVQALEEKIQFKKNEIQAIADASKAAELQLKFLDSLASGYAKDAWLEASTANADTASWQQALNLMQQGSLQAYEVVRDNKSKSIELNKDLQLLVKQLNAQRDPTKSNATLVLSAAADAPISSALRVYYFRNQAGWSPTYEARLDIAERHLVLAQKARVWQSTSEVWKDVNITLSSSRPSQNMQAPLVDSQFYDLFEPRLYEGFAGGAYGGLEEVVVTSTTVARARTQKKKPSPVRIEEPSWQGEYAQVVDVAGVVTISNNRDQAQRFDIQNYEFDVELITQILPIQDQQAYLSARINHKGDSPIYGNSMQVYSDGVLMGSATMPTILPGKDTVLAMGVDQQIEVNVIDQGGQGGETGIIGKRFTQKADLKFEIRNRRRSASQLEVRAVYPVSRNRDLKMKIDADATPATIEDEEGKKGVYLWKKELAGNELWEIDYGYSMSYPDDKELGRTP